MKTIDLIDIAADLAGNGKAAAALAVLDADSRLRLADGEYRGADWIATIREGDIGQVRWLAYFQHKILTNEA